jgi:hypothetical protein
VLPPSPSTVLFLDEEVAANEEGIDDDADAAAAADNTDADDYAADNIAAAADDDADNDATMPPKVKPLPTKPTKKDIAAAAAKPPPPAAAAAAAATSFSVDAEDPLTAHYYAVGAYDYANVVLHVNGTMQNSEYQIRVAKDSLLVSFMRAICSCSFDKKILRKIMGVEYRKSSAHVVALDDTALEMQAKNVRPMNGLFWGEPQVVRLRWKCTGTHTHNDKHNYPTEYKVKDKKGVWHVQCDCIVLVTVRKTEEQTQAKLEVESSYVNLFRINSSQSQRSDGPPSPPPCRHKKREERHAVDYSKDEEQIP